MIRHFLFCSIVFAFAVSTVGEAQTDFEIQIAHYEWPHNPLVDEVLRIPQLRSAIAHFDERASATMVIRYPGGDQGDEWAKSLRDVLVSLGIRLSEIVLEPGSGLPETLLLIVTESSNY